jgi:cytochrome c peroxidase
MAHRQLILKFFNVAPLVLISVMLLVSACASPRDTWTDDDLTLLRSLWIGTLESLPPNPSNAVADDPRAAALGKALFFDTRFSTNGEVACATCHKPELMFQDGIPLAHGIGTTNRRAMTIVGAAYSPWLFWDGRKDSLWAQALGPMENAVEHGGNRTQYAHLIAQHYSDEYEALFGPLPALIDLPASAGPVEDAAARAAWDAMPVADQDAATQIYVNMGKSIEAYERLLVPGPSRFDAYVEAVLNNDTKTAEESLSPDEVAGLRLFIGEANCIRCHNGPLFTDNDFHNTGIPAATDLPEDSGRAQGAHLVQDDEFNCLSQWSDASEDDCDELTFILADGEQLIRAFKPPSLRNANGRGPFMHAGQFTSLEQVLDHYNRAPDSPAGHSEIHPLNLTEQQIQQIIAFLKSLTGPINAAPEWLSSNN